MRETLRCLDNSEYPCESQLDLLDRICASVNRPSRELLLPGRFGEKRMSRVIGAPLVRRRSRLDVCFYINAGVTNSPTYLISFEASEATQLFDMAASIELLLSPINNNTKSLEFARDSQRVDESNLAVDESDHRPAWSLFGRRLTSLWDPSYPAREFP